MQTHFHFELDRKIPQKITLFISLILLLHCEACSNHSGFHFFFIRIIYRSFEMQWFFICSDELQCVTKALKYCDITVPISLTINYNWISQYRKRIWSHFYSHRFQHRRENRPDVVFFISFVWKPWHEKHQQLSWTKTWKNCVVQWVSIHFTLSYFCSIWLILWAMER